MAKITLKDIKAKTDGIDGIKTETASIKTATSKIADIETKVGKIASIETDVKKIANIDTKVKEMETKIQTLSKLIGEQDSGNDHTKDTGIYKVIHDNFTELMG